MSSDSSGGVWWVDAHCHLHERYDLDRALDAAAGLLEHPPRSPGERPTSVLLLADTPKQSSFARLDAQPCRRWHIDRLEDGLCRRATDDRGHVVLLVAGQQLPAQEGVEVLALGCLDPIPPHQPTADLIRLVGRQGGLAVLPWGFGKWTGRRGRLIEQLVCQGTRKGEPDPVLGPVLDWAFFLGDNGGRAGRGQPRMFDLARARGLRILPGSDPLPLRGQEGRVGSFGFEMPAGDPELPWHSLTRALSDPAFTPVPCGGRSAWPAFFLQQTVMLFRKYLPF